MSTPLRRFVAVFSVLALSASTWAGPVPAPAASLQELLQPLTQDRLFRESEVAWQVVSLRTGEEVFGYQPDEAVVPASTMKVITAASALDALGPAFRFKTTWSSEGEIDPTGTLQGDLVIKGGGDPTFMTENLWKMFRDLRLEGVTKIQGDVIFDESYFGPDHVLPGWDKRDDLEQGPSYYPVMSALSLNHNNVALVVGAGGEVGKAAVVQLETPASDYIIVENLVKTGAPGSTRWLKVERSVEGEEEKLKFSVTGSIPSDSGVRRYYRSIVDPTAHYMAAWKEMASQMGLSVTGKMKLGAKSPGGDVLVEHRSPALATVLGEMNKHSNNFIAEQVLRVLGAERGGLPGTTEKGVTVVKAYLHGLGIPEDEVVLVNGSGLSREIQIRPSHLNAVMVDMANNSQVGREFGASLSISGMDGTLWRRLAEEPGVIRGKTGTLDGVHCLAGYLEGGDGETYAFSFLVNGVRGNSSKVKRVHDQFARKVRSLSEPALDAAAEEEEP